MHRPYQARHRAKPANYRLRRAVLTVGMAGAFTGTFAVTTVSPASAGLCDPEVSIEIQMNTSNASGCADAGEVGSIDPSPIVQAVVEWVITAPDGVVTSGSTTEDVSGGSGSDAPLPIDIVDLGSLADAAGAKKCRPGDGWDVKSYYEVRTKFYVAFRYHEDFTYTYDCKNVTNVYNWKIYPTAVMSWQGWEFQGNETPPSGVSTYPKPTVSIIGQGKFAQCLPTPIGQYCTNQHIVTITWDAFGSGARPTGQAVDS